MAWDIFNLSNLSQSLKDKLFWYGIAIVVGILILIAIYRTASGEKGTWTSIKGIPIVYKSGDVHWTGERSDDGNSYQSSYMGSRNRASFLPTHVDQSRKQQQPPKKGGGYTSGRYKRPNSPGYKSKGELECRRVLEHLYPGYEFSTHRPKFLSNPVTDGRWNMELDCYNPQLQIAVEYNGKQHYTYTPYFHRNQDAFYNQKYRDELKRRLCAEAGVLLIEVPYTVTFNKIPGFITSKLRAAGKL